jgi:signal transduction histidine kinase
MKAQPTIAMTALPGALSRVSRALLLAGILLLTAFIGYLDYATGPRVSMSVFYFLPLALSAWFLDLKFTLGILVVGIGVGITANTMNGDPGFTTVGLVSWNAAVQLISDTVVVVALTQLRKLQRTLEARVRERAAALTGEIAKRERLQGELLEASELEQRRIGQDLHDGLCQHLAGTALTCQVLREELAEKHLSEAVRAQKIVELIEEGVVLARQSARGFDPIALDADGLMRALEEFAATTTKLFKVECVFECDSPVFIHNATAAEQLFRIAQEAVRNAVNHGRPQKIVVELKSVEEGLELRIEDNGLGMRKAIRSGAGMGMRIMRRRARAVGATLEAEPGTNGGTMVTCKLPLALEIGTSIRERPQS